MRYFLMTALLLTAAHLNVTGAAQESDLWSGPRAIPTVITRIEIRDKLEVSVDIPGTLKEVVQVGDIVRKGDTVVRLNDAVIRAELKVIEAQYNEAKTNAESDVLIDFAIVKRDTAKVELDVRIDANKKAAKQIDRGPVFTATEINRAELDVKQGDAEIKKATHDKKVASLAAVTKSVEMEAKQIELEQYSVQSEIDGIVTEVVHPAGESVRQGDPILTITNIDVVKAVLEVDEAYKSRFKVGDRVLLRFNLDTSLDRRSAGQGADSFFTDGAKDAAAEPEATLTSSTSDDAKLTFEGEVVLISPALVSTEHHLEVTAKINNQRDDQGRPLLRDGQQVQAVILGD